MTITYQNSLGSPGVSGFAVLLFKWKGSLYKLCYKELTIFIIAFNIISAVNRHALKPEEKKLFKQLVGYFQKYLDMIPLSFILGFYVTIIATRWWQQYLALPSPDRLMFSICLYLPGTDDESRQLRKTLLRYCHLMLILVLRSVSDSVRSRLSSVEDIVDAGFMTAAEMECFLSVKSNVNLYWVPGMWFIHLLRKVRQEGRVRDAQGLKLITEEFLKFRSCCGILWSYDWVCIPLVYTQVVTMATYSFFIACLFGRQYVEEEKGGITADVYFPLWTILQFLFYMGLLKVAEQMINPYGHDDADFDLNFLINRHIEVINLGADKLWDSHPLIADNKICKGVLINAQRKKSSPVKSKHSRPLHELCIVENEETVPTTLKRTEEGRASFGLASAAKSKLSRPFQELCTVENGDKVPSILKRTEEERAAFGFASAAKKKLSHSFHEYPCTKM